MAGIVPWSRMEAQSSIKATISHTRAQLGLLLYVEAFLNRCLGGSDNLVYPPAIREAMESLRNDCLCQAELLKLKIQRLGSGLEQ